MVRIINIGALFLIIFISVSNATEVEDKARIRALTAKINMLEERIAKLEKRITALEGKLDQAVKIKEAHDKPPEYKVISEFGEDNAFKMVYMSEAGLKDKKYIAQVLQKITTGKEDFLQVFFFNDPKHTPKEFPMTDVQMLHHRASYKKNTNTGLNRFRFFVVTNPYSSPPEVKVIEAVIRPGYAD